MKNIDSILKQNKEIKDFRVYDVDAEWASFQNLVQTPDSNVTDEEVVNFVPKSKMNWKLVLSMAASFILVVAILFLMNKPQKLTDTLVTNDAPDTLKMVDGSIVYLDKYSTIEYPLVLDKLTERKLKLVGNAKFDVAQNKTLPFKVYYGDIFVEVLGTVFSISKSNGKSTIENSEGSVKVAQVLNKGNFVVLKEGESFHYENGIFKNVLDTLVVEKIVEPVKIVRKKEKPKDITPEPEPEVVVEEPKAEEFSGSTFKLESVVKGHLLKYFKDKVKLEKKVKLEMDARVKLDISKPYIEILEALKAQGVISYKPGECADCFIITAPE